MPIAALQAILDAYGEGRAAIRVSGRPLHDLGVDPADRRVRPLIELFRSTIRDRYGMLLLTYSMAAGLDWDSSRIEDERDRRTIETVLRAHGLLDIPQDQNEVIRVIRGIASLSRTPTSGLRWASGQDLRFAFLLEFGEHLAPGALTNGTQTEQQLIAIELAHLTAQSLALRASGNFVVFSSRDGMLDDLVAGALHHVRLPQPDPGEKLEFVESALQLYDQARLDADLTPPMVVHLTTNTPNRGVESILRASHRAGHAVTPHQLTDGKARDVADLSEGTLSLLDTTRVRDLDLQGRNIAAPMAILRRYGEALARGDHAMPICVLLVGPPGTGKTDLAIYSGAVAGVAALELHSPKDSLVGGTERRARLQQVLLSEWVPNVAFVDEITEALPLQRVDFDGDSGATKAVTASLLTALSDETRRGRSLLIGTTNCPWRMGAAMRSRFVCIPVLHPLPGDFPAIVVATARRVAPGLAVTAEDPLIHAAGEIFYSKGANPRHIRAAVSSALLRHGSLSPGDILRAAQKLKMPSATDLYSAQYADLWAIKSATSLEDLPWDADLTSYPFPLHLKGIVDPQTGEVDMGRLDGRIAELEPRANV